jgi:hypothetical protein
MSIVQISQIKHRHGVQSDLPQLATAELGWSVDTRKLYIGNGTLSEGAPEIGNTEILTEHSSLPGITVYTQAISSNVFVNTTANLTYALADYNKPAIYIQYACTRDIDTRVGWLKIARNLSNVAVYSLDEEYTETANLGLTWEATGVGGGGPGSYLQIVANLSPGATSANIQYTISTLSF